MSKLRMARAIRWVPAALAAVALLATGPTGTPERAASAGQRASTPSVEEVSDRTTCAGSVTGVLTNLNGDAADRLEGLQAKYEDTAGFRAVVFDGKYATIVVDDRSLDAWRQRLSGSEVGVAPSCVSDEAIEAASQAIRTFDYRPGEFASAGYDALSDAVIVHSTFDTQDVVRALEKAVSVERPGDYIGDARRDGTLRLRKEAPGDAVRSGRTNDTSPFRGGGRTYIGNNGCTTGFYIDSDTNGTVMVTAGHCSDGDNGRSGLERERHRAGGYDRGCAVPEP